MVDSTGAPLYWHAVVKVSRNFRYQRSAKRIGGGTSRYHVFFTLKCWHRAHKRIQPPRAVEKTEYRHSRSLPWKVLFYIDFYWIGTANGDKRKLGNALESMGELVHEPRDQAVLWSIGVATLISYPLRFSPSSLCVRAPHTHKINRTQSHTLRRCLSASCLPDVAYSSVSTLHSLPLKVSKSSQKNVHVNSK